MATPDALQSSSMKQPATNLESNAVLALLKTKAGEMPVFNFNISFNMKENLNWLISLKWTATNSIGIKYHLSYYMYVVFVYQNSATCIFAVLLCGEL